MITSYKVIGDGIMRDRIAPLSRTDVNLIAVATTVFPQSIAYK